MQLNERMRFIGEDGSLGYRNGQWYSLTIRVAHIGPNPLTILSPRRCPYGSIQAFMRNWTVN